MTIYKNRHKHTVTFKNVINNVLARKNIEENMAQERNTVCQFRHKWRILENLK